MRMRKLGSSHTLVFIAPDEVIEEARNFVPGENVAVDSSHILLWTMEETCRQLQTNVANWAAQGYEFAARQTGWNRASNENGITSGKDIEILFCQAEGKSLEHLYGLGQMRSIRRSTNNPQSRRIVEKIEQHCLLFESFSFIDARTQEEQEVELIHEQEVEREVERPPSAMPATHSLHRHVEEFVRTGILDVSSSAFRTIPQSFVGSSLAVPSGGTGVFKDIIVTEDFYRTIKQSTSNSNIDDFLRPVEWVVTSQEQNFPALVAFSPYEVNVLLPIFRNSRKAKLHLFAARSNLSMRPLDDLQLFTLPSYLTISPPVPHIAQQLNLYSGTLYLPDFLRYRELCALLRLHFGHVPSEIADRGVINSNGYVKDGTSRAELGLAGKGFEEDPVQFLRKLFHLRRNGRSFRPSHMGQILFGMGLTEASFDVHVNEDDEDSV